MRVLYLTNNPNLGSTARVLQDWLIQGRSQGTLTGSVVVPGPGAFADWLAEKDLPFLIDAMPWPDLRRPWKALPHLLRVARWARRRGIDLVHCNEHDVHPFGTMLARLLRRPLVSHVQFKVTRAFCEWTFRRRRAPDALIWTSRHQRAYCADAVAGLISPDSQYVIPLGLDAEQWATYPVDRDAIRASWGFGPEHIVIGCACAIRPVKRVHEFVTVAGRVLARHPQAAAVVAGGCVAGDEAYVRQVRETAAALPEPNRLHFAGNLTRMEPFMHAIDLFVSTSEYETFGMSVCEAMACRKPVAAYTGGSVEEVVGDTGLIVEIGDLDGLERSIGRLVADDALRTELGVRARQRVVDTFDGKKSLRQIMSVYADLAAERRPSAEACLATTAAHGDQ